MQQVLHILGRKPVLRRRGRLDADGFRYGQHGPPKVVKEVHDQPGAWMRELMQATEQCLHVGPIHDFIGELRETGLALDEQDCHAKLHTELRLQFVARTMMD